MDELLTALNRDGYVLRRDALRLGWHDRALRHGVQAGLLLRVRHGTYVLAETWRAASDSQRLAITSRSALARLGPGYVLSHTSAAAVRGLDLYGTDLRTVHVTSVRGHTGRVDAGVVHHESALSADDVEEVDGVPVVRVARSVLETACMATVEGTMVTACSALRTGMTQHAELLEMTGRFSRRRGIRTARLGLSLTDAGCHSAGEARSLFLCWRHHLPRPECQVPVHDADGLAGVVDMGWLAWHHVGEFDGLVKYGRENPWSSDPTSTLVAEKLREDRIRDTGLGMSRWTWHALDPSRSDGTAARLRAALERSRSWYSTPA